jgi:hypothetical protein
MMTMPDEDRNANDPLRKIAGIILYRRLRTDRPERLRRCGVEFCISADSFWTTDVVDQ